MTSIEQENAELKTRISALEFSLWCIEKEQDLKRENLFLQARNQFLYNDNRKLHDDLLTLQEMYRNDRTR